MDPFDDEPESSSIKPVSSLRSQFENLSSVPSGSSKPASTILTQSKPISIARGAKVATSRDLQVSQSDQAKVTEKNNNGGDGFLDTTRAKRKPPTPPKSRRPVSVSQPYPRTTTPQIDIKAPTSPRRISVVQTRDSAQHGTLTPTDSRSETPLEQSSRHFQIPSRTSGASSPSAGALSLQATDLASSYPPRQSSLQHFRSEAPAKLPPPVNRSAKPIRGRSVGNKSSMAPQTASEEHGAGVSPFGTPPSDNEPLQTELPPPLPIHSKPRPSTADSSHEMLHYPKSSAEDEAPPELPPRRNVIPSRSQEVLQASRSKPSALSQGFTNKAKPPLLRQANEEHYSRGSRSTTPSPLPMVVSEGRRTHQISRHPATNLERDNDEQPTLSDTSASPVSEFPDSSRANRRFPHYSDNPRSISTGYDPRILDMCGKFVCTAGSITRVWELLTGKLLLSITHGEGVKATAVCFKPSRKIDEEGTRLWLGTNSGEILEVDIGSKRVIDSESSAHSRCEVIKMHRRATEIWTIDSEGKLFLWPADDSGSPKLNACVPNGRLGRRPTASIIVDEKLWVARGKDLRIYKPSSQSDQALAVNLQSIGQEAAGDIASAGQLSDRVYFGHSDGKISVYSKVTYEFVDLVAVSIYKITSLVGLGDYLWVAQTNGLLCVYDTSSTPWKTKKDWRAHSGPAMQLSADLSNIWKLDRMMALSLGVDNNICIWDGMLEDDRIEDDMQAHKTEYCDFADVTSLVLTWNTGATKPSDLRYERESSNFFQELVQLKNYPDIIVFGLQELVDLEDKALTAKSFFKSRNKDHTGHEHLSSVYREWRDYLSRCLEHSNPTGDYYTILHTASLVGLFSCVFVKDSQRGRIRNVQAAEIKTGMGGLHGNKGAIAIRCVMDDSSLCFINCHLAAGQSKIDDRNNDVTAILESPHLPQIGASSGTVIGGGDGSMILDNEICVLNGDLNYRIDAMSRDGVINALKARNLSKLLDRDQLLLSRRKNPGFRLRNFHELPITFDPTYKYDIRSDTYDSSEKRRSPAWCDRIMCRGSVRQHDYERHEIRVSDHRPVSASFSFMVKEVSRGKREVSLKKAQQRFQEFKMKISNDSKLQYLVSVFGLTIQEAEKELSSIRDQQKR